MKKGIFQSAQTKSAQDIQYLNNLLYRGGICVTEHVCRLEDHLEESILSFQHVSPGDRTQVLRLSRKHLYPLSHLAYPQI